MGRGIQLLHHKDCKSVEDGMCYCGAAKFCLPDPTIYQYCHDVRCEKPHRDELGRELKYP